MAIAALCCVLGSVGFLLYCERFSSAVETLNQFPSVNNLEARMPLSVEFWLGKTFAHFDSTNDRGSSGLELGERKSQGHFRLPPLIL